MSLYAYLYCQQPRSRLRSSSFYSWHPSLCFLSQQQVRPMWQPSLQQVVLSLVAASTSSKLPAPVRSIQWRQMHEYYRLVQYGCHCTLSADFLSSENTVFLTDFWEEAVASVWSFVVFGSFDDECCSSNKLSASAVEKSTTVKREQCDNKGVMLWIQTSLTKQTFGSLQLFLSNLLQTLHIEI